MIRQFGVLFVFGLLASLGCGGPSYGTPVKVTGKILVAGQPAKEVRVIFQSNDGKLPADKRFATATVGADGAFTMDTVYPSEYTVMLESAAPPPADPGSASAVPKSNLPVDENGAAKTVKITVPNEKNEYTIDF